MELSTRQNDHRSHQADNKCENGSESKLKNRIGPIPEKVKAKTVMSIVDRSQSDRNKSKSQFQSFVPTIYSAIDGSIEYCTKIVGDKTRARIGGQSYALLSTTNTKSSWLLLILTVFIPAELRSSWQRGICCERAIRSQTPISVGNIDDQLFLVK
jgi:hypothetical protein